MEAAPGKPVFSLQRMAAISQLQSAAGVPAVVLTPSGQQALELATRLIVAHTAATAWNCSAVPGGRVVLGRQDVSAALVTEPSLGFAVECVPCADLVCRGMCDT